VIFISKELTESLFIVHSTAEMSVVCCCMCEGSDSAYKTPRRAAASRTKSTSKEVEDELASMRGTKDVDRVNYLERKEIREVCDVEEEPRVGTRLARGAQSVPGPANEDSDERSLSRVSRESSPAARPVHQPKRHHVTSASDKGTPCALMNF